MVTSNKVIIKSYAKINLTLDVTKKRKDGYHDIVTIMQTIGLFDVVTIEKTRRNGITLSTNLSFLPTDERNIAYRAAKLFFERALVLCDIKIHLEKSIPVGAGLAGGSSNAAAVLVGLNRMFGSPLTQKQLSGIGAELGADVPFCMQCGTALCKGIGDIVTPLADAPLMHLLVVKPKLSISTRDIYKILDTTEVPSHPDTNAMLDAITSGSVKSIAKNLANVLENVTEPRYPVIKGIKQTMKNQGALGCMMSGSGSAVYGIFTTAAAADKCAKSFYPDFRDVYSVSTFKGF